MIQSSLQRAKMQSFRGSQLIHINIFIFTMRNIKAISKNLDFDSGQGASPFIEVLGEDAFLTLKESDK